MIDTSHLLSFSDEFSRLTENSQLVHHCSPAIWSEGPVYHAETNTLIWSDIPNKRMLAWSPTKGVSIFREDSHFSNGNTLDLEGRLVTCEHGRRCISRTNHDGSIEILVDRWNGKRLNSPNDVIVKSDGSIWFSDPAYGIMSDVEGYRAESEIGADHVYRYDPESKTISPMVTDVEKPNGLAFSPDEKRLYVSDTSASHDSDGRHEIRVYDIDEHGRPGNGRVFCEVTPGLPDGFRLDERGNLYTSSEDSIQVYNADGKCLGKILIPEKIANCTFGGRDFDTLYIVATTSLYSIRLNTRGDIRRTARFPNPQ